jgi:hypothetical protein
MREPASETSFDRFQSLARRLLTTPKAQLVKGTEKAKAVKPAKGKQGK